MVRFVHSCAMQSTLLRRTNAYYRLSLVTITALLSTRTIASHFTSASTEQSRQRSPNRLTTFYHHQHLNTILRAAERRRKVHRPITRQTGKFLIIVPHSIVLPRYGTIVFHSCYVLCFSLKKTIFTARRNARIASAVLVAAIPSVCPSVCLSVTRRYCVKTTARSTVQFALSDSKMCLVL